MFRWGFVGSAGIAVTVAKELKRNKDFKIVAVYSKNFEHCKKFSKRFGATPYKTFEDMLADKKIDAIYVATPHTYHYYYSKRALEKHIPVICEKTLTLNLASAQELFKIAEENHTYFVEAMWTWFNPTAYKVKEWIDQNRIGQVKTMKADFTVPSLYISRKERLFSPERGGGSLYDLGVYPVTYAYRLFGYPSKITAKGKLKNGIDISCRVEFEYENGIKCVLTSGFNKIGLVNATIKGSEGSIRVPTCFHSARSARLSGKDELTYRDAENLKLYEREFVKAAQEIKAGLMKSELVKPEDTLNVLKILEEIKNQIGLAYPDDRK